MISFPAPKAHLRAQNSIKEEQVSQLVKMVNSGSLATLFTASLYAYLLHDQVRSDYLFSWLLLVVLLAILRHSFWHAILSERFRIPLELESFIRLGNFAAGLTWGISAFLLFPAESLLHQAFHAIILGGLVAGAIGFYAISMPAYLCFSTPVMVPLIARHLTVPGQDHKLLGYLLFYFFILMIVTATKANKYALKNISLGQVNKDLIDQLRTEQKETLQSNKLLAQEIDEKNILEKELFSYRDHLERLVEKRTEDLRSEIQIRRNSEAKLEHQAYHDALTGLPNRTLLKERLERCMKRSRRTGQKLALLFMDLNDFKNVNDTLGHNAGDLLLQNVSVRLIECCRDEDAVARISGDEFMIIIENVSEGIPEVQLVCDRLITTLERPHYIAGQNLEVKASIGITIYPDDGQDVETLIKNSDMAMYKAKKDKLYSYALFTKTMDEEMQHRVSMERDLRRAVTNQEFVLHYQPKVDIQTNIIVGAEALIRWQSSTGSLIPPNFFIPVAESTGLIHPMGEWALETACQQTKEWIAAGYSNFNMAVNISANQFQRFNLPETVRQIIEEINLPPANLTLEITENIVMDDVESAIQVMDSLAALGVGIAIDDFGTGYSSLSYLKRFPINILKIDRSFVRDLPHDADDMVIASTIIDLAHNLGATVVAEGVETTEQLQVMIEKQCEEVQGYYYSPPLPAEDFFKLLSTGVTSHKAS